MSLKKAFESPELFSQYHFPEKGEFCQIWIGHVMWLEGLLLFSLSFFSLKQSWKSGRLFGSGSGLKLTKISGLIRAWDVLFALGAQKYNQNNLATLLNFSDLRVFFGHDFGF